MADWMAEAREEREEPCIPAWLLPKALGRGGGEGGWVGSCFGSSFINYLLVLDFVGSG